MRLILRCGVGFLMSGLFSGAAWAQDSTDAEARIIELEKQMKSLSQELIEVRKQLSQSKEDAKNSGSNTVHASFKEGLVLADESGNWSLRPYVRLQLDGRTFSPDNFNADTYTMRRARLGAIATFFKDFSLRIEGEYGEGGASSSGNTRLNDAYLEYNRWSGANIRVGQFKPYYGLERTTGAMDLNFMERSLSDAVIGSTFDRGLMLHGEPLAGLYFHVAYVNGTGQNVDETDARYDNKDISARLTGNIAQWMGWKDSVVHVGGWYAYGEQGTGSAIPTIRTEGRGVTFFSTCEKKNCSADDKRNNQFTTSVDRTRYGLETALAHGPVKFQSEYVRTSFDGQGFNRDMSAWYASAQWLVTGEHYADRYKKSAFGRLIPTRNFDSNDGWGALELGMRYSRFDASDFNFDNPAGTGRLWKETGKTIGSNEADAWTLGAKWVLNPYAMIMLNYVHTAFDTPITVNSKVDDSENALNMRLQFDF